MILIHMNEDFLYQYKAFVTGVYDGDSITVNIDLGFGVWLNDQKLRLSNIDTPEIRGDERTDGLIVRNLVRNRILEKTITILTEKDGKGKYGRWLATVYMDDGTNLNEMLLSEGHADIYGS